MSSILYPIESGGLESCKILKLSTFWFDTVLRQCRKTSKCTRVLSNLAPRPKEGHRKMQKLPGKGVILSCKRQDGHEIMDMYLPIPIPFLRQALGSSRSTRRRALTRLCKSTSFTSMANRLIYNKLVHSIGFCLFLHHRLEFVGRRQGGAFQI